MHNATNCPVCRAQRELEVELVRDDIHNAVASEWKNMPLVRTGPGGFYTQDYEPKPEPIKWRWLLLIVSWIGSGAVLWRLCRSK